MSKELEAFNDICCNTNQNYPDFQKQRKIVETALKKLNKIEQSLTKEGFNSLKGFIKQLDEYVKISEKEHEEFMMLESKSKELLTTIEEKQKNAESQLIGNHDLDKRERLKGEIEAYYDIVCLIKFKYGIEK